MAVLAWDKPQLLDKEEFSIKVNGKEIKVQQSISARQKELLRLGGLINGVKQDLQKK